MKFLLELFNSTRKTLRCIVACSTNIGSLVLFLKAVSLPHGWWLSDWLAYLTYNSVLLCPAHESTLFCPIVKPADYRSAFVCIVTVETISIGHNFVGSTTCEYIVGINKSVIIKGANETWRVSEHSGGAAVSITNKLNLKTLPFSYCNNTYVQTVPR